MLCNFYCLHTVQKHTRLHPVYWLPHCIKLKEPDTHTLRRYRIEIYLYKALKPFLNAEPLWQPKETRYFRPSENFMANN